LSCAPAGRPAVVGAGRRRGGRATRAGAW